MNTSPLPWRVEPVGTDRATIVDRDGKQVAGVLGLADAKLIVRAVRLPGAHGFGQRAACTQKPNFAYRTLVIEGEESVRKILA